MFFWKIQLTIFRSDVSNPIMIFSQIVLAADPGLETSRLKIVSWIFQKNIIIITTTEILMNHFNIIYL